jgi:hypothetical protein
VDDILSLMRLGMSQSRVSFGGAIGFDWNAIEMLAAKAGVETDVFWWELFSTGEREWCAIVNKPKPKQE